MKRKLVAALLTVAMTLSLTACGGEKENSADGGQYYNIYLQTEPSTLDSIKGNDNYSWKILMNTMEPLTRLAEKDGEQVREAAGAESWESNDDGTVWTFKIRDNKWTDGKAVTAADYAYGIIQTLNPDAGSPNSFFTASYIKNGSKVVNGEASVDELGVKVVDDKTLEITLDRKSVV